MNAIDYIEKSNKYTPPGYGANIDEINFFYGRERTDSQRIKTNVGLLACGSLYTFGGLIGTAYSEQVIDYLASGYFSASGLGMIHLGIQSVSETFSHKNRVN